MGDDSAGDEADYNWGVSFEPFDDYKVYGPYPDRRQGREMVTLVSPTHRTTTPYPRYLMAMKLGRRLRPDEHVDHIDNNPSNNALENL